MYFAFIDLEYNQVKKESFPQILEIGILIVNSNGNVVKRFSSYVKHSTVYINPYVTKVTGITYDLLNRQGKMLRRLMSNLKDIFKDVEYVFSYGNDDLWILLQNLKKYKLRCGFLNNKKSIDIQRVYMDIHNIELRPSLISVTSDMDFLQGHSAENDAYRTLHIFRQLGLEAVMNNRRMRINKNLYEHMRKDKGLCKCGGNTRVDYIFCDSDNETYTSLYSCNECNRNYKTSISIDSLSSLVIGCKKFINKNQYFSYLQYHYKDSIK